MASLKEALRASDYLTFTGHGGRNYWRLNEGTIFRTSDMPALDHPIVVTAASCKTFRLWDKGSIALAALIVELVLYEVAFALLRARASQPRPAAAGRCTVSW